MSFKNRKSVLNAAKEAISREIYERIDLLTKKRDELASSLGEECSKDPEFLKVESQIRAAYEESNSWHSSKRSKKKKSIEWSDDRTRKQISHGKPRRQIVNFEAAREVVDNQSNLVNNNSSWLSEGSLVVHRDDKETLMVVIKNNPKTGSAKVLKDGQVWAVRSLSLRPAYLD